MISVFLRGKLCSWFLGDMLSELGLSSLEFARLVGPIGDGLAVTRLMKESMSNVGKCWESFGDSLTAIMEDRACLFAGGEETLERFIGLLSSLERKEKVNLYKTIEKSFAE